MSMRIIDTQAVYDDLMVEVRRLERRLRWQDAVRGLPIAIGAGFAMAALFAAAVRVWPVYNQTRQVQIIVGLMALALALNFIFAFLRPRPRIEIARRIDQAMNLNERVSSAVDAHRRNAQGTMVALLTADATRQASAADMQQAFPMRLNLRDVIFSLALGVLLLLAIFAPNPFEAAARQREAVKATQQQVATKIQQVQHEIEQAPNADDPVRQQLLTEIESLQHDLAQGNLSREQALARMQQTEDNLKKLEDPAALAEKEALNRLGQELSKFTDPALQSIANNLQLGNFQDAAQGLHDLANNIPNLNSAQLSSLQSALAQAAAAIANVDPKLAALLQQAANALKNGDTQAARQALDQASSAVADDAQSIAAQQQLQQALAQVQNGEQTVAQAGQPTPAAGAQATAVAANGSNPSGTPQPGAQQGDQANAAGTPQPGQTAGTPDAGSQQPGANPQNGSQSGSSSGSNQANNGTNPSGSQQGGGSSSGGLSGDKIYAPEPNTNPAANGTPLPLNSNGNGNGSGGGKPIGPGSGGAAGGNVGSNGGGASGNSSQVPYNQVYKQYNDKATSDLQNSYIPQNLKSYVRDYFTSLAPQ